MRPEQAAAMVVAESATWPAEPLQPAYTWAAANPLIVGVIIVVLIVAAFRGWKKLIMRQQDAGGTLAPLGMVISRFVRLAFREDNYKMLQRPEKVAARLEWLTWRRYAWALLAVTVVWFLVPPTNFTTLPGQDADMLWLYGLGVVAVGWLMLVQHARTVVRYRHRTLMQMFAVASSECKYEAGSETNPWGWVQIRSWTNVYWPGETSVMFPPRYRSEDLRNREAFERNFNGTVSDAHSWTYKWESANNRVLCSPVPHIPEQAPYPFPDTKPWNVFPLGEASGGKEATVDVTVFPHMLIAGTTGSGKSVTQRTILLHCLQHPDWRVVLIDPKRVELSIYRNARNVLKVATELEDMTELIEQVEQEMHSRYTKMSEEGVNNFADMNEPPPAVLLMVDEVFALLSPENIKSDEGKERDALHARCTGLIGSIARLGRAAGVHLVLATQRPDAKVLPGETRALALDTPLPTPGGWTTVGRVETGDVVFDESGQPTTVTGTTEVMHDHDCYRVHFSDGTSIVADGGHLWLTHSVGYRESRSRAAKRVRQGLASRPHAQPKVVTTAQMAATLTCRGKRNHAIPVAGALVLPEQELPIPPYVLGVWLGGGNRCATTFASADDGVVEAVRQEGFGVYPVASDKQGVTWQFVEAGTAPSRWAPGVEGKLRDLNLLQNKHIPDMYARASRRQRRELLQGLMDTGGRNVGRAPRDGGDISGASRVCFTSDDLRLAGQVLELARSLGYRPTLTSEPPQQSDGGCSGETSWKVMWTPREQVFRLPRKIAGQNLHPEHTDVEMRYRYVVDVERVESVPVKCIAVDSASRLFLAGEGMVPTHNSNLDCRIAQGRMDTTPSLMVLDSDAATMLPPVKGRAMLRAGNDFTEFQAYFCPPDQLPQLMEMADGLASGVVTPQDLLPPEDEGGKGRGGRLSWLRMPRLPRLPKVKLPVPRRFREGFAGWARRRREVVEANRSVLDVPDGSVGEVAGQAGRDLTMEEVDRVAASASVTGPSLFEVTVEGDGLVDYGPRVGDVLRESARRGEPIAASELISALHADLREVEMEIGQLPDADMYPPEGFDGASWPGSDGMPDVAASPEDDSAFEPEPEPEPAQMPAGTPVRPAGGAARPARPNTSPARPTRPTRPTRPS